LEQIVLNLVMIAIFLGVAFPVHEFAHAWVAYLRGDATAKLFGRLTLNPVVHFDPIGGVMTAVSVFLGGFLFGWAKPTPVNTANLRDRRNDEVIVALAGPASNLLMALLGAAIIRGLDLVGLPVYEDIVGASLALFRDGGIQPAELFAYALYLFVVFNVALAVFNLLPIPPLDGSTLLFRALPAERVWQVRPFLAQYGIFILLAFVLLGGRLISTVVFNVARILVGL
jgi:Zn-dependent protease